MPSPARVAQPSKATSQEKRWRSLAFPLRFGLATIVTVLATPAIAEAAPPAAPRLSAADHLDCTGATDDTARLRALIETGGAAAGRTLFVPSGCKLLLGSPGAARSVADVASDTTIACEDGTAGFVLARRACDPASAARGAACSTDVQCGSGRCVGDAFAPDESATYVVFGAAAGSSRQAIVGCGIWVNGGSGESVATGGDGRRWGYCDGAGSSVLGEGCFNACGQAAGARAGLACLTDTDCGGTATSCEARVGDCKSRGGACIAVPYATNWGASGPGSIDVVAWGKALGSRVEGVTVYDHRRGNASIAVGSGGLVRDSSNAGNSLPGAQFGAVFGATLATVEGSLACSMASSPCLTATVDKGIVAGSETTVDRSVGYGWTAGIHAKGLNLVSGSTGGGYGNPGEAGWYGNADLLISNAGVVVQGFRGGTSLYCVLPEVGSGLNFIVQNAFCDGNVGAKFIVQNAGNQYLGVRGAWHGRGAVIGLGDQRGRCAGGPRAGRVCVFGAHADARIGCPDGACEAHPDFRAGSSNHFVVGGGSLLHSQLGADVAFLRATDSRRCTAAATPGYGAPCKVDTDCAVGSCDYLTWTNGLIDGVLLYNGAGATAFDLATSGVGVSRADGSSIGSWLVSGVGLQGFARGFAFPPPARFCTGGLGAASNNGAACSVDGACKSTCRGGTSNGLACSTNADCPGGSCGGTPRCMGPIHDLAVIGDAGGVTTPLVGWDWSYGDVSGLKGLTATDDQPTIVRIRASESLTRGQLVSVADSMDHAVARTTTGARERAVGVVLADTESGHLAKVQTAGVGPCVASAPGGIERGALLTPSATTAGAVASLTTKGDPIVATALEAAAAGATFRCLVGIR